MDVSFNFQTRRKWAMIFASFMNSGCRYKSRDSFGNLVYSSFSDNNEKSDILRYRARVLNNSQIIVRAYYWDTGVSGHLILVVSVSPKSIRKQNAL